MSKELNIAAAGGNCIRVDATKEGVRVTLMSSMTEPRDTMCKYRLCAR